MESELSGISNESQISWFGFSAVSFSDSVFNAYVDSWKEVCEKEFAGALKDMSDKDRISLLAFPFKEKSIEKRFKIMKRYCVSDIFNIPDSITLPECKKMQEAAAKDPMDHGKAEKEIASKLEKIRQLRVKLNEKKAEIDKQNEAIAVLHEMEKAQEQLIKQNKTVLESPGRKPSSV